MVRFLRLLKLNETLFALPFAYSGVLLAYKRLDVLDSIKIIWITLAMVGARTFGMLMNRVIDRHIDAINPRTKDRDLPSGKMTVNSILIIAIFALMDDSEQISLDLLEKGLKIFLNLLLLLGSGYS